MFKQVASTPQKVFWVTLLFYAVLWLLSPTNKIILALFFGLIVVYSWLTKKLHLSFFLAYIASLVIVTGKTYEIQLVPIGLFPIDWWPNGYIVKLILTNSFVLLLFLGAFVVRQFIQTTKDLTVKLSILDIVIVGEIIWLFVSALFGSQNPQLSFVATVLGIPGYISYVYLSTFAKDNQLIALLVSVIAAIVLFESMISLHQMLISSPVGKTIEFQLTIEDFGQAVDELAFRFRPVGTLSHANDLATLLVVTLPLLISYIINRKSTHIFVSCVAGIVALILTLSRSGWLGFGSALLFIFYYYRHVPLFLQEFWLKAKVGIILISFIIGGLFIVPRLQQSLNSFSDLGGGAFVRLEQIQTSLTLIALHPLFGVGSLMGVPESILLEPEGVFAHFPSSVHNAFILLAVENGIPMLLLRLTLIGIGFGIALKIIKSSLSKDVRFPLIGMWAGVLGMLVITIFQPFFKMEFFLLFLGVTMQQIRD